MYAMWREKVHWHMHFLFQRQENIVYLYRIAEQKM